MLLPLHPVIKPCPTKKVPTPLPTCGGEGVLELFSCPFYR